MDEVAVKIRQHILDGAKIRKVGEKYNVYIKVGFLRERIVEISPHIIGTMDKRWVVLFGCVRNPDEVSSLYSAAEESYQKIVDEEYFLEKEKENKILQKIRKSFL